MLSLPEAVSLVFLRAKAMTAACEELAGGQMLRLVAAADQVQSLLSASGADAVVSVFNGPQDTVVSGAAPELAKLQAAAQAASIECAMLHTQG